MVGDYNVRATIAVSDVPRAREFYEGTLGLKVVSDEREVIYQSGDVHVQVYKSGFAGSNKATAATWEVEGIEDLVAGLTGKGVAFEHYDMPGITLEGDVHVMEGLKAVWFKDPDGNILCLHELLS